MLESIRIEVSGNAEALQPTVDKLKEIGAVDKKNADQFKKNNEEFQLAAKKREEALQHEIKNLEALKRARDKAYTPENIAGFNKSIAQSQERIKLLGAETAGAANKMTALGAAAAGTGEAIKKTYGFARLMANIIPGLGIGGVLLYGWEALSKIFGELGEDLDKLKTADTEFAAVSISNINDIIERNRALQQILRENEILQKIQSRELQEIDLKKAQASFDNQTELAKIAVKYNLEAVELEKVRAEQEDAINKERLRQGKEVVGELADFDKNANQRKLDALVLAEQESQRKILAINTEKSTELDKQNKIYYAKLARLRAEDDAKNNKLIRDISFQDLENKKKEIEAQFKIDSNAAKISIEDKIELDERLFELEEARTIEILFLNEEIAKKKLAQDRKTAFATITDQETLNNRLYNIELAYNDKISGLRNDYYQGRRTAESDFNSLILADLEKASADNAKEVQNDLKNRLKEVKDNEQRLADVLKLQNEKNFTEGRIKQEEFDKQEIKDQIAVLELKKTNLDQYSNEYIEIEIKEQQLLRQLREKDKKEREKDVKQAIENLQQIADAVIELNKQRIEANIDAIDRQQDLQKDAVEVQRRQAELGRDNTLAFEEKRAADLEKQRMQEQKKLIKLKELETFLNSVASFSKDDPESAVAKALAQLAIIKGYEATFMEEGGILGHESNSKSWLGRKHKGGGDILVHAQTGEGFFSRKEIASMGGEQAFLNFKNMLGNNQLPPIPMTGVMFQGFDTKKLEDKIDTLNHTIKNKKETDINFDAMGNMIVTTTENGIKEIMKHVLRKPRI